MSDVVRRLTVSTLLLILLALVPAQAQRGARTAPQALDELTHEASLIVRGSVISATVEPHPQFSNLMTVLVSLQVESTLKGSAPKTLQFRQFIWDIRDQLDAASYRKGDHLLLLLGPVSQYGLRSPVGLGQGRFKITRDAGGNLLAVNERGNQGLFDSTENRAKAQNLRLTPSTMKLVRQKVSGPLPLTSVEGAIKEFAGASR